MDFFPIIAEIFVPMPIELDNVPRREKVTLLVRDLGRMLKSEQNVKASKHVQSIQKSAVRMNRQINDLLDAVKIEKGTFQLELKHSPIFGVIEDAIESASFAFQEKEIQICAHVEDQLPAILCDFDRILQCLTNLIGNAVKFSPKGSLVDVYVTQQESELMFRIKNFGPGILNKDRPHLFERFWQNNKTAHQGTGLGLFIAKSIVEAHGGKIGIEDDAGPGTVFFFTIPKRENGTSAEGKFRKAI